MKNPIAGWSDRRIGVLFGAWLVLSIAGSLAICWSDRSLITSVYQRSQQLELTSSSACASCIVSDWNDRRCSDCIHIARRGIWIDTLWFVPAYSTLLALCCFWIGKHAGGSALLAPAALLGWASWSAGLLDWIENAGMLAQLRSHRAAALTGTAANLKWVLVLVISLFVGLAAVRRFLIFCEDRLHGYEDRRRRQGDD